MHMKVANEWLGPWNLRDAWDLANVCRVGMLPPKLDQSLELRVETEVCKPSQGAMPKSPVQVPTP